VKLYTSRWQNRNLEKLDVVPVGISVAVPRFLVRYRYRRLAELQPDPWMLSIKDDASFERCYRRKLDRLGVEQIGALLQQIANEEGGKPICLLCYENVWAGQVCHRRMFARWFEQRTGIVVEELPDTGTSRAAQERLF
jgi:hypothetical protein